MSIKMQNINIRISSELQEQIRQKAKALNMTQSDFVRTSIERMLDADTTHATHHDTQNTTQALHILDRQLEQKDAQIQRIQTDLNEQIRQLTGELSASRRGTEDAGKRSDMIVAQMTQQLDRAALQLEDLRQKRSWWQRVFSRGTVESVTGFPPG